MNLIVRHGEKAIIGVSDEQSMQNDTNDEREGFEQDFNELEESIMRLSSDLPIKKKILEQLDNCETQEDLDEVRVILENFLKKEKRF